MPVPATPEPRRSFFRKLALSVGVGAGIALVPTAASAAPTYCRDECTRATNGCAWIPDPVNGGGFYTAPYNCKNKCTNATWTEWFALSSCPGTYCKKKVRVGTC